MKQEGQEELEYKEHLPVEGKDGKQGHDKKDDYDNDNDSDGVMISEEYQKKAHELTNKASKQHLDHLSSRISMRHDELRKEEASKEKHPKEYSDAEMPRS